MYILLWADAKEKNKNSLACDLDRRRIRLGISRWGYEAVDHQSHPQNQKL